MSTHQRVERGSIYERTDESHGTGSDSLMDWIH